MNNSHSFVEITNQDIYREIKIQFKETRDEINCMKRKSAVTSWIATTALTLSLISIGVLVAT